jgi:hypothetical protein
LYPGLQLYDSCQSLEQFTGPKAVTFAGTGFIRMAMAGVSGRMPAVGIVTASVVSGYATSGDHPSEMGVLVRYAGRVNSFAFNFSGYNNGQAIWVGQSGDLVLTPPTGSGMPQQIIGMVTNGSGMFVGSMPTLDIDPMNLNPRGGNISMIGACPDFQSGRGIIFLANCGATPSGNPSGGGFYYALSGALYWRGSLGTITKIADP